MRFSLFAGALALAVAASTQLAAPRSAAAQTIAAGPTALVRVVHGSPDAGPVFVKVDGTTVLANFLYGTITTYIPLSPGRYKISIVTAGGAAVTAAVDVPRSRFSAVSITRGLAAALLIALAGDAFLATRLGPGRAVVTVATPAPAATAAGPRATATAVPVIGHAASAARPLFPLEPPHSPTSASSTSASATAARERPARDSETIAQLKHELAIVEQQARFDRGRVRLLQRDLALAKAQSHADGGVPPFVVLATPIPAPSVDGATPIPARSVFGGTPIPAPSGADATPVPSQSVAGATPVPPPPVAGETAVSGPPDDALVAALRSGKVYAIDAAVDGEAWHLTIVQPRAGERAVIYSGTPDAPSGQTYRTWVLRAGRIVNAGELVPGRPATLQMPMVLEPGDVIAFSREPDGTADQPTQPFLMQLKIGQ